MKLKNEELVARRMRTEADETQYREQEEARRLAQEEQRAKMKQKKEDDSRIQNVIEYGRGVGESNGLVFNERKPGKEKLENLLNGIRINRLLTKMVCKCTIKS